LHNGDNISKRRSLQLHPRTLCNSNDHCIEPCTRQTKDSNTEPPATRLSISISDEGLAATLALDSKIFATNHLPIEPCDSKNQYNNKQLTASRLQKKEHDASILDRAPMDQPSNSKQNLAHQCSPFLHAPISGKKKTALRPCSCS
jgi:hypothetical protein